jgi:glutamate dehydrogenase/leucine dehydrogenase
MFADAQVSCIPDFISNCGMARVFAYLMTDDAKLDEHSIFNDVSQTIYSALEECHDRRKNTKMLTDTAYSIALEKLM